jgi:flavin reductase (DIM6/NTAB) family NADH-FMN oxidoreductase RutF
MTLDTRSAAYTGKVLSPYPGAVTTIHNGRTNGLMALSGSSGGIVPEAPRFQINLTKYNFTHDLVLKSGVFAFHLLPAAPDEALQASLNIIRALAGRSGRDGDKLAGLATRPGVTGAPILLDALTYIEAKVVKAFDADEHTIFVGDVVAAETFHRDPALDIGKAWSLLSKEWLDAYNHNHHPQTDAARASRGLPQTGEVRL